MCCIELLKANRGNISIQKKKTIKIITLVINNLPAILPEYSLKIILIILYIINLLLVIIMKNVIILLKNIILSGFRFK